MNKLKQDEQKGQLENKILLVFFKYNFLDCILFLVTKYLYSLKSEMWIQVINR